MPSAEPGAGTGAEPATVEFTADGYLRVGLDVATEFFPSNALVAIPKGGELWLLPLIGPESGGMLLKQRNLHGDRSALIWEILPVPRPIGVRQATWDATHGALRVDARVDTTRVRA